MVFSCSEQQRSIMIKNQGGYSVFVVVKSVNRPHRFQAVDEYFRVGGARNKALSRGMKLEASDLPSVIPEPICYGSGAIVNIYSTVSRSGRLRRPQERKKFRSRVKRKGE